MIVFTPQQLQIVQSSPLFIAADDLAVALSARARARYTVEAINASARASELSMWIAHDILQERLEREAEAAAAADNGNGHSHGGSDADS